MYWTQFKKPEHLSRMAQFVGVAILVWTACGVAATKAKPTLRFNHSKKGPRFSYVTIGMRSRENVMRRMPLNVHNVCAHIPKPVLRNFPWIRLCLETI